MSFKQLIPYLRLAHALYNTVVMLLFMYQGYLGLKIRRQRRAGIQVPKIIKRHRKAGPVLALLGVAGFFTGSGLVYAEYGFLVKYPLHLITGFVIAFSISATFMISRKIKGTDDRWRTPHFAVGISILCLYVFQVFLGIGILF